MDEGPVSVEADDASVETSGDADLDRSHTGTEAEAPTSPLDRSRSRVVERPPVTAETPKAPPPTPTSPAAPMVHSPPAAEKQTAKKLRFDDDSPRHDTGARGSADAAPTLPLADPLDIPVPEGPDDPDATVTYPDLDATREYDDAGNAMYADCPQSWLTFKMSAMKCTKASPEVRWDAGTEYIYHAMADARRCLEAAECSDLPWNSTQAFIVIPGSWEKQRCFYYDFADDRCFSVTRDELLTERDVADNFQAVEAADAKEIASFVHHEVFELDLATNSFNTVDAVWVRKWVTRNPPVVKSRCCGRGFLDTQKSKIDRHSSTASVLSHRLGLTLTAQQLQWIMEAFDVSTAFLQGLRFQEVAERAKALGHDVQQPRSVWLRPPANVWRHLRSLNFSTVRDAERMLFLLHLLKAMYGLVDGPLMFQMAFLHFLITELSFRSSLHDENFLYYVDPSLGDLMAIIIIHVDDLLVMATYEFIRWIQDAVERRFGKLKRNELPFTWCGIVHECLKPGHYFLHQTQYLDKLNPICPSRKYNDTSELADIDFSAVRSLIMSFLWLCRTRQDVLQTVVALQTEMLFPTGNTLRTVNALVRSAKANRHLNGLHFCYVGFPARLVQVSDSGHITKNSSYPQEGRMVLYCADHVDLQRGTTEFHYGLAAGKFGGPCCPLFVSSKKAQRVSHSTSHSETNPAVSCSAVAVLVANRITELEFFRHNKRAPCARDLLDLQLRGEHVIPVDICTDAMNLFEMICHSKSLPNDKHHRVGILALREDRLCRRLRNVIHLPTSIMLADPLTKAMVSLIFMHYTTTGVWKTSLSTARDVNLRIRIRRGVLRPSTYTERDLLENTYSDADGTVGDRLVLDTDLEQALEYLQTVL